jgi:deazaflavin-dependent oxidoreductase (nitroreductase family)
MTQTRGMSPAEANARNGYLTTYGRASGNAHEVEIWFAIDPESDGRRLYMLSGGRDRSDWVKNLRRNPRVRFRAGAASFEGVGRLVAPGEPLDLRARQVVAAKYQEWDERRELSRWARESLPVVVELDGAADSGR